MNTVKQYQFENQRIKMCFKMSFEDGQKGSLPDVSQEANKGADLPVQFKIPLQLNTRIQD